MKIAVLIKQTLDTEAIIELDEEGRINKERAKNIINPYDEYAVEEAVRIKERLGAEVTVVTLGPAKAGESLRQALAMGADRALLLCDSKFYDTDEYSKAVFLAHALAETRYDLVLAGWTSVDSGSAQTAVRVAELLDLPQVTVVDSLAFEDNRVVATRETDEGKETIEADLPALVTVQKGINEPRYPSFLGIMQAKKKEIIKISLPELGLDGAVAGLGGAKVAIDKVFLPSRKRQGRIIKGVPAEMCSHIVEFLHREIKII